jgi:ubiquinone biosynthesis protein
MLFDQTFKNIRRVREIASILWRYGFEEFVANTALGTFVPSKQRLAWKIEQEKHKQYSRWELTRMAAEELGPTFIKLAQALSNRPDVLPLELIHELEKLQNDVPPFPFEQVEKIIQTSTGKPLRQLFSDFGRKPIGSASIGQVHRATLLNGSKVVVKVQRPGVREKVLTDLSIMKELVRRGDKFLEAQGVFNGIEIMDAFEKSMKKELDYTNEARFMQQFRNYYKDYKNFYVPEVYKQLSNEAMLVMEFVDGCKITDVARLRSWGLSPEKIAESGIDIYLTQIFEHGYFHADPHPGNIIVKMDGTLCLIDFGMVGKLSKRDKHAFTGMLIGLAQQDPAKMAKSLKRLAVDSNIKDEQAFEADLAELVDDYATQSLDEVNAAEVVERMLSVIRKNRIRLPGSIFLISRALTILEGIGKTIHPSFNTFEFFKPYGIKLLREQYSLGNMTAELMNVLDGVYALATSLPFETKAILQQARQGKLRWQVALEGQSEAVDKLVHSINRMSLALVVLGLLLASAVLLVADSLSPSSLARYLAVAGFILASLLIFLLLWGVWKSRRRL